MFFISKTHTYTIGDLFEIFQGTAIISKKSQINTSDGIKYKTIYISDLPDKYETLNFLELNGYESQKKIKKEKLLTENDYLLSCKGGIKGYALCKSLNIFNELASSEYQGIVASNHFIVLRPRTSTIEIFQKSYLLYNLIDIIIPQLNQFASEKSNKVKLPYITISELQNYSFSMPGSNFDNVITEFQKLYLERHENIRSLNKIDKKINEFNKLFKSSIFPKS
jgi:hypothetical protein